MLSSLLRFRTLAASQAIGCRQRQELGPEALNRAEDVLQCGIIGWEESPDELWGQEMRSRALICSATDRQLQGIELG